MTAQGHTATAVTLGGLGEEWPAGAVTLDSHIDEVVSLVDDNSTVVLVGHSYAGSVITGAADRVPERVRALVYLDAFVPDDGDSCYTMTNDEQRSWYLDGAGRTGIGVDPLPFFDDRAKPHPLATLMQRSKLTGAWRGVPVKHYAAALNWPDGSPFAPTTARLQDDPLWTVHEWQSKHNVLGDVPELVLELLLGL